MARFFARMKGSRGEATRLGTPASGITTETMSYAGTVQVRMYAFRPDKGQDIDWVLVTLQPHPSYQGGHADTVVTLYDGPCAGWEGYRDRGQLGRMTWHMEHAGRGSVLASVNDNYDSRKDEVAS